MNGLMKASVSLGSSHLAASVTCRPHVSVPSGAATAGATQAGRSRQTTSVIFMAPPVRVSECRRRPGIKRFSTLYLGHLELERCALAGTPAHARPPAH